MGVVRGKVCKIAKNHPMCKGVGCTEAILANKSLHWKGACMIIPAETE